MSECSRCGAEFSCGVVAEQPCWCQQYPPVLAVPSAAASCWCPACLAAELAARSPVPLSAAPDTD
ncbi:cysteine-rich CWC family protein [Chitinibacter tainanensis]|uniref:cysteine-rich CWC family protein n=1 Tax=Chitinibacter tainanensis TaxID=230667 RepID=UPI0009FCA337